MAPDPTTETSPLLGPSGTKNHGDSSLKEMPPLPLRSRLCRCLSSVTVEPALFLMSLGYGMESTFKTNMLVDKTCSIQLQYSADICHDLDSGNYKTQQDATQRLTADYNLYCQLIELLPGALITVLLGVWSDTRGRRLPLLLPTIGSTLKTFALCCNAFWWSLQPFYVLLSFIPSGLTGGIMAKFMAAYAYLSENSSLRGRTTRLSIAGMTLYVAMPLGNALGAVLFSYRGYIAVFGMDFIVSFLAVIYLVIRLRNEKPKSTAETTEGRTMLLSQLRRSLAAVTRQRTAGGRACILGHVGCIALYVIAFGAMSFILLYTRKRFQWDYKQYTLWSALNSVASFIASSMVLPLLSLRCKLEDTVLAFIGSALYVFFWILMGTAPNASYLYFAVVLASAGGFTISCSRGALSKLVAPAELGAVFSVVGLFESLAPIITLPLYTLVYDYTLDIFPGTVFLISAVVTLLICCIYTKLATAFPATPAAGPKAEQAHHSI